MTKQGVAGAWCCSVCGYVHQGAEPPDVCPVCGVDKSAFEPHETEAIPAVVVSSWICLNCSYVHEGAEPPESCLVCGAAADRFQPESREEPEEAGTFNGRLLVVGAGIAGVTAVESFRKHAPDAQVVLLSAEQELPYYRLNLTRFLAGDCTESELPIHEQAWYDENLIELRTGAEIDEILPESGEVRLKNGERMAYDRLILAAGAHPFIPPFQGVKKSGVLALRTLANARAILDRVQPEMKCICIGGGLLGLETAGALAARGAAVTMLEGHDWLMPRQLNRRAGEILLSHVERLGITVLRNARTKEILGSEQVSGVLLQDGRSIPADLVIIATGVRPNSHLGRRLELEVDKGVVVDHYLRTSLPNIYAAGDVAEHNGVLYGSWAAAQFQGSIAGMNAAGLKVEFGGVSRSNTLKVLGVDLVSIGRFVPEDGSCTVLESESEEAYCRLVFQDGRLIGAVLVGDASVAGPVKKHIEQETDFSASLLDAGTAFDFLTNF